MAPQRRLSRPLRSSVARPLARPLSRPLARRAGPLLTLALALAGGSVALGQPAPHGPVAPGSSAKQAASASPALSTSVRPAASASGALPPGHPDVAPGDPSQGPLPSGHPQVAPHGDSPGGAGRFRMPLQSGAREEPGVPAGTIQVSVKDGEGNPLPGMEVTLGIVENSIAKGENRQRKTGKADASGVVTFSGLETASAFAYRVSVVRDGATYAAPPFNMPTTGVGIAASIFAYPVTREVDQATVAMQGILYFELRDEVIQVEQGYRIYNLGGTTWLASGTPVELPEGFKAFNAQQGMSDIGWDASGKQAKLRGTISPGSHDAAFRYQLPAPERDELTIDAGILPHVQSFRVIVEAPKGMTLDVEGFPPAQVMTTGNGQRVLVTEKETQRLDPTFRRVKIKLGGLPTKPQGRWVALGLALSALAAAVWASGKLKAEPVGSREELSAAKAKLLEELSALEKARASGEVGPKTYDRARRALLDALARVLAQSETI